MADDLLRRVANVIGSAVWPADGNGATPHTAPEDAARLLADAGLLLPVGGETREEWAVRVDEPVRGRSEKPGDLMTHLGEEKSRRCREVWSGWTPMTRTITDYPNGFVHTSPWRSVTEEPSR